MQLRCRQCHSELHAADVDMAALKARCSKCGWTFGRAISPFRLGAPEATTTPAPTSRRRPGLPRPAEVDVLHEPSDGQFVARYRSSRLITRGVVLAAIALFGVMLGVMLALHAPYNPAAYLPFVAAGVFGPLAFWCLRRWPTVVVGAGRIGCKYPHRAGRRIEFATDDIAQLYVDQGADYDDNNVYGVRALFKNGDDRLIVGHITHAVHALYLEQELERLLGIEDSRVRGEYERA